MIETQKTVATRSPAMDRVVSDAQLPRTIAAGTDAMRAAGEKYLPKEPAETSTAYKIRVARTPLFNAFGKTVDDMTGKVFRQPIVLNDDVPPILLEYAEDIDRAGRHVNVFARDLFHDGLQTGVSYILVDAPVADANRVRTVADAKAAGVRPYLVHVTAENLLGWRTEDIGGVLTLTQVRIRETVTEPDGDYHDTEIEQIRVLTRGAWQTFRKAPGSDTKWVEYQSGTSGVGKITLVPVYFNRTGFMTGRTPLFKLAELNVTHWQSGSDQRNILHVARVPILFGAGFGENDTLVIGAGSMVKSSDIGAKLEYVEHTGAAIDAGREDLKDLEFQMQTMGLQLLVPNPGQTATGEVRDDSKENSPLAMMARGLGDALEQAFAYLGEYAGLGENSGGSLVVNTDFGIQAGALVDIPNIVSAHSSGLISRETAWAEMKRRNFLSDDFDPETEASRLESEAPALDAGAGRGLDLNPPGGA